MEHVIEPLLERYKKTIRNYWVHRADLSKLRELSFDFIDKICKPDSEVDPRDDRNRFLVFGLYDGIRRHLALLGYLLAGKDILIEVWNKYQCIQRDEKIRVYMAGIALALSDLYMDQGDLGAATRWALITDAADILYNENRGGARQRLREWYGIPEEALDHIREIAILNRKLAMVRNDWSVPEAFAEDTIAKFLAKHQKYGALFARHSTTVKEYPISQAYYRSLFERISTASAATQRGKALEDLATYLVSLIPGWIPRRNVKTVNNEYESDIVVSNLMEVGNLNSELFGRNFLIECKNWSRPVGTSAIGYFLYRMRFAHTKFGILFSLSGITGERRKNTASKSLIQRAFNEDGSICVVINRNDLEQLGHGESFWAMLVEKSRSIQFGDSTFRIH